MKNKIAYLALSLAVLTMLGGLAWLIVRGDSEQSGDGQVRVTASFYPLAEFARQVGGDRVHVTTLVAPGTEPHDYEPKPGDVANLYKSAVFVYNGAGLEPWADKLKTDLQKNDVVSVNASQTIKLQSAPAHRHEAEEDDHHAQANDPHVWLDPMLAVQQVKAIEAGLIQADPGHRETYERNAAAYTAQLQALDVAFQKGLKACQQRQIVSAHQSFGYLASHYSFTALGIAGLSPDDEPSPQKLAEVASFVREHQLRYIFFETLVSPKLAETIAQETGAQTLAFNPLEGLSPDEIRQGKDYLSIQNDNLRALRTAMNCQ